MSQQVKVFRDLTFTGRANQGYMMGHASNVQGKFNPALVTFYDDFLGDVISDEWAPEVANGGACAIVAAANGVVRLTANSADNDKAELVSELNWYAQQACCMEARIKVDNITNVGIFVGFTDAKGEGDDQIPFEINADTIVDRCSDGAGFVFDTDATTDKWYTVNTKAGTQAGVITAFAPVNATYEVFGIHFDTDGTAHFYRNGEFVAVKPAAVTPTVALTPCVSVIARAGSSPRNVDVDYIKCWQLRRESSTVLW